MSSGDGMPMLPWYHRDFLAATQGWRLAERGAYFLLLGAQWEMGPLPKDVSELALIVGTSANEFRRIWRKVSRKFMATKDGLVNARLELHRQKAVGLRARHQSGAKQTNQKRWGPQATDAAHVAEQSLSESPCVSPPSPSPSPSFKRLSKGAGDYLRSDDGLIATARIET
jgi:uncharacterized protein YdaU (DUF1376 family)